MKKTLTLNEEQLHSFLAECVKRVLKNKQVQLQESRIRRIVSECIAQECGGVKGGLEETGGKYGMGSMTSDLDAMKDQRDNMSVYDSRYEELCDKIDRMEEMLQRIINAQKGGLQPVAEGKKGK